MPIADDGTVQFRDDERVDFSHIIRKKHLGDAIELRVLRDGQEKLLSYELGQLRPLVPVLHGLDCMPSYFIVGGLVFVPLSIPFLEHAFGARKWRQMSPVPILAMIPEFREFPDEQVPCPGSLPKGYGVLHSRLSFWSKSWLQN